MTILECMGIPDAPESVQVELRCPEPVYRWRCSCGTPGCAYDYRRCPGGGQRVRDCNPGKLFAMLQTTGEKPSYIQPDNLIVMACRDCKNALRRRGQRVFRVLHCYDFAGTLVKTLREEFPDD